MKKNIRSILKKFHSLAVSILPTDIYAKIFFNISYIINCITVSKYTESSKFKKIEELESFYTPKSDTVFILGSGSSINSISDLEWSQIQSNDSIGLNFWHLHKFIPSIFVFEESYDNERTNLFYEILIKRNKDYKDTSIIVKDVETKGISKGKIPINLSNNIYLSTDITIGNSKNLDEFFVNVFESCVKKNRKKLKVIPKKTGSLSYCIFLAIFLGYKDIVLCGVDLENTDFFYYSKEYENIKVPKNDNKGLNSHLTESEYNNNIPISEILRIIDNEILKDKNVNLYNLSKNNNKLDFLKTYKFDSN